MIGGSPQTAVLFLNRSEKTWPFSVPSGTPIRWMSDKLKNRK